MAARIADISEVLLQLGLTNTVSDLERSLANEALKRSEAAIRRHLKYDPAQESRTEFYPGMDFRQQGRETIWEVSDTQAYVRFLSETATDELQVRHIPIRSITSLKIDYDGRAGTRANSFGDSTEQTEGVDFWPNYDMYDSSGNAVCSDGIIRAEGRWPAQPGSIKIVYVAGYTDAEFHGEDEVIDASPILEAVVDEAIRRFKKFWSRKKQILAGHIAGPMQSETLGDYSYSIDTSILARLVGGTTDIMPETEHKLADFLNYGWMMAS